MSARDKRVDAYIARSAEFARPILTRLRDVVHAACPDVDETIKWSFPVFMYHGMLCHMAAFKAHATFGLWKGALIAGVGQTGQRNSMGQYGKLTSVKDLPTKRALVTQIKAAMRLNESGTKVPRRRRTARPTPRVPADLRVGLRTNRKAAATFAALPPGQRREYTDWLAGAKTDTTRQRRLATTIAWLAKGKTHNWKYEKR